jgi:hypothetical protein
MKRIMFTIACILVSASFAQASYKDANAKRICDNSFDRASNSAVCNDVIEDKAYDLGSLQVCAQMLQPSNLISCLRVTGNLQFSDSVLNYCARKDQELSRVECLQMASANATRIAAPNSCKPKEVVVVKVVETVSPQALEGLKTRTSNIYESLRNGDRSKALDQVVSLFDRINELQKEVAELKK